MSTTAASHGTSLSEAPHFRLEPAGRSSPRGYDAPQKTAGTNGRTTLFPVRPQPSRISILMTWPTIAADARIVPGLGSPLQPASPHAMIRRDSTVALCDPRTSHECYRTLDESVTR